ncbi:TIGR00341 family protein [uncultured Porphyromonas sp.]|uniref:TIGR00341 family protein n=1 Tax=uncultured Porphyromonas sp. TaxID=159274 RepID=UPI002638577C|nr:TIGR00341 family protein [uncultured Porphyromonas sp.]
MSTQPSNPKPEDAEQPQVKKNEGFVGFLKEYFDLGLDKENELKTIESIAADVDFKGPKMWILICAIFIASLGLNMNSTAVIIGAMLISPLMGPILGFGLGLGITDFKLVKRSLKNLGMMTLIGITTATVYFLLSPVETITSELLARTQPTFYDVLIASFGGLAGITAGASKNKGNVIPGVAIATALMPPLCTAGYGIATMNVHYFIGAFYLYIINAVFIGLATYITVRALDYPRVTYVDKKRGRLLNRAVAAIVICTLLPSIYLAWQMVQTTVKEQAERNFIRSEITGDDRYVLSYDSYKRGDSTFMTVNVLGAEITEEEEKVLDAKLDGYGLHKTALMIQQNYDRQNVQRLRSSILDDVYRGNGGRGTADLVAYQHYQIDSLQRLLSQYAIIGEESQRLAVDMKALFPEVSQLEFGDVITYNQDSLEVVRPDTTFLVRIYTRSSKLTEEREQTIRRWVAIRIPRSRVDILTSAKKK